MDWHHRLYHLSFPKIFCLAEKGFLLKGLLKCKGSLPLCVACQFRTAHQRPWHTKGKASGSIRRPERVLPGNGVSINQIVSAQPGLIPQMSGFFTSRRIWGCTTFCDHVSDFVYVHPMQDYTVDKTILAVKAFKKVMAQANRTVKHYHTNNGAFAHKGFLGEVNRKAQKITFCAVGVHHQNGIIDNKNKMLTLAARTLLLHGIRMWPQMMDTMFWPFVFKAAAERHNQLFLTATGQTPLSILHDVPVENIPVKTFHTLLCLVCVLDSHSQSAGGPGPPKWEPRSCIGVYLGYSPFNAGSVALVFNPKTGRVSPQYHVVFDDTFLTVPFMDAGTVPPHWEDLLKYSSKKATDEDFSFAKDWMDLIVKVPEDHPNVPAGSCITDPFAVITEESNTLHANATRAAHTPQDQPLEAHGTNASKGGDKRISPSLPSLSDAAANLAMKQRGLPPTDDAAA